MARLDPSNFKKSFFDRAAVAGGLEKAKRAALARSGGLVMAIARRSMRRRAAGTHSPPGSPPFAHSGDLRDRLFFAYDRATESVVVGPERLNGKQYRGQVPALLEFGGTVPGNGRTIWVKAPRQRGRRAKWAKVVVKGSMVYEPRPYMRPAFEKALPKLAGFFKDTFGRDARAAVAGSAAAAA